MKKLKIKANKQYEVTASLNGVDYVTGIGMLESVDYSKDTVIVTLHLNKDLTKAEK